MIFSYLSHKKMVLNGYGMKIIATSSTIAYRDITQSFQNEKQMVLISDDEYNQLDINKNFDFIGDILLTKNILDKYIPLIIKKYIENLDEDNRNKIIKAYYNLESLVQDSLFLEDLPLELDFSEDLKKFLKLENLHLDSKFLKEPYAIIESILRIHQTCNLKTVPVVCNVAHYLDSTQLNMLNNLLKLMKLKMILIEFTSKDVLVYPKDADYFYIDQDLVDWY